MQSRQHPRKRATGAAALGCSPASPSSPAASPSQLSAYWEALGLQPSGGEAPGGATSPAEKGTGDVAERLPNIQPLGFPAVKTHQVSALNTALLQD